MATVSKGVLKAKMLAYFRQVEKTGEPLVVTDHRVPVLKIVPIRRKTSLVSAFTDLQGSLKATEEALLEPTQDEWEQA
jgi:antitoxin (DNA-binding transcriptional repressor) of toxin-antitoxin stability system